MLFCVLYFLALLILPSLSTLSSHAETPVDSESTIGISPSDTVVIPLSQGEFSASSPQTITASTNNYTGYTLAFSSKSTQTDLVNFADENLAIPTITLNNGEIAKTASDFDYGYGYSLDGTNYKPIPGSTVDDETDTAAADILEHTTSAGTGVTNLNFGVKTTKDTPPGAYQNQFMLTVNANEITYTIDFSSNTDDPVINMPEKALVGTFNGIGVAFELSNQTPGRYPYTFIGWSEDKDLTNDSILYQPGESFILDPTKNGAHTLYAHWEFRCHPNATTISHSEDATILTDAICMQDMNVHVAKNMTEEDQYTLYDSRDMKPYFVSMLKDGNVWMTQNLDLGDAEKSYTLTSADTDLKDGQTFTLPAFSDPETIVFDTDIYNQNQRFALPNPTVKDGGDKYYVAQKTQQQT